MSNARHHAYATLVQIALFDLFTLCSIVMLASVQSNRLIFRNYF